MRSFLGSLYSSQALLLLLPGWTHQLRLLIHRLTAFSSSIALGDCVRMRRPFGVKGNLWGCEAPHHRALNMRPALRSLVSDAGDAPEACRAPRAQPGQPRPGTSQRFQLRAPHTRPAATRSGRIPPPPCPCPASSSSAMQLCGRAVVWWSEMASIGNGTVRRLLTPTMAASAS